MKPKRYTTAKKVKGSKTRSKPKAAKRRVTRTTARTPRASTKRSRTRAARRPIPESREIGSAWQRIAPHVAARLRARGWDDPGPDVVRTIAALAAGYRKGPAADPPFATELDGDAAVADAFIDFYSMGARSPAPERRARLPIVRRTVSFNLRQLGIAASNLARDTLARIALGIWRPGLDEIARLNGLASFLVPWYRAGLA